MLKDLTQIGEELRTLRGELSREEVALALEVTVSAITNYESGARMPRDEIKERLAKFYGKTVGDLFFGE